MSAKRYWQSYQILLYLYKSYWPIGLGHFMQLDDVIVYLFSSFVLYIPILRFRKFRMLIITCFTINFFDRVTLNQEHIY